MANTWKNLSDGDITRRALAIFHNKLKFIKTINRQYDNRFAKTGYKNDGQLLIKMPNEYNVTTGATMVTQDTTETTQTLAVTTQKHVGLNFDSFEKTMSIEDFEHQCLHPAMSKLAADVEYTVMSNVYKDVGNFSGTAANTPDALIDVLNGGVKISQGLAPEGDRHFITESVSMAGLVNSVGLYFHKASELEKAFSEGYIGHAAGLKWWETNMLPTHTNGTRDDTTPVCDTSTIAEGATTIAVTALNPAASTIKQGDVFTLAGVYAINRETKQAYSHLQQFTVTADVTASGGNATVAIYPTWYDSTTDARQTLSDTTGASAALVFEAAGGSGTASAVYAQPMVYHKDAFTFVSADLYMKEGETMSRANMEGISMRLWKGADIKNDEFPCRIDVLFGYKTLRPEWACRVRG